MEDYKCEMLRWEEAYRLARKAAEKIKAEGYAPDTIIGITRGGWVPSMMLSDLLGVRDLLSVRVEHWGVTGTKDKKANLKYPLQADLSGKKVLLVDDLTDTGDSMLLALEDVKKHDPALVRTATLIHKQQSKYRPDYFALETDKWQWIILPWNLTEDICSLSGKVKGNERMDVEGIRKGLKERFALDIDAKTLEETLEMGCKEWG
jgi:hypoxanthine phosphoribosyltransferase